MDSDEDDYVFYGTPIEREEEITSRRKKSIAEASGHLRTLAPWKQEVRDEEGRRRFHGAFTGGFSAGYYNTVGSKEGWTPQTFTSSRKNRAEVKQQSILNFLDEDEKAELEGKSLGTSSQFDTFGFTAAEFARKQAEKEQQQRPSAIPGPVPDELLVPATESIGVKLLLKMGWRRGRSIKDSHADSLYAARREARKALLAFSYGDAKTPPTDSEPVGSHQESFVEQPVKDDVQLSRSTPVYVLNPKQDLHGLGYDPYKHAPEFREKKRSRMSDDKEPGNRKALSIKDSLFGLKSGKVASGFGIGALEEYDAEDDDVYGADYDFVDTYVEEDEEPSRFSKDNRQKLIGREQGVLPGFIVSSKSDYQLERFDPPVVPKDFVPHHKFPGPLEADTNLAVPVPPEVPPPEDNNLKLLIEGVATLVARCGKLFEDLSREKNQSNPLFSFLSGGNGHDYYARKLWEALQKRNNQTKPLSDGKSSQTVQKMTAETRGKLLGERPLERSARESSSSVGSENVIQIQFNMSDTFIKSTSFSELQEVAKPFKYDPAKQERFEQFLKDKYRGGLRSTESSGASNMSEAARARERLDFEAAAEAIEKAKCGKESAISMQQLMEFSAAGGMQFTSDGVEKVKDTQAGDLITTNVYPRREEFQWRPSPILCKRFDLIDPYMGKPPPAPRIRSKMDSLIFTSDSVKATKLEESAAANNNQYSATQSDAPEMSRYVTEKQIEVEVEVENVERPVDLYKAIFSDDSDDEMETFDPKKVEDPEKKIQVANTALSHLIAGDFLESLGKELGLELPPELPNSTTKAENPAGQKETSNADVGNANILPVEIKSSTANAGSRTLIDQGMPDQRETIQKGDSEKNEFISGNPLNDGDKYKETDLSEYRHGKVGRERTKEDGKSKLPSSRHRNRGGSPSSEDERSRKRSRRHQYRSSDSYSDSSSDHRERYHSRSKSKKGSSRVKSTSIRKHRGRGDGDSPGRSHYDTEKERATGKKEKKKRRD